MKTQIERLAGFVSGLKHEDIPELTLRAARCQVLDMIAAVHAAAGSAEVMPLLESAEGFTAAGGRATVLLTGRKRGPADAALANAVCSIAFDYDDIVWMGHTCHSAVFASLAVAEHENRSSRDFLTAVVAANEIGGRIGASCIFGPLNGQMWTFIHLAGAAAATSKLLGLDAEKTAHALAIALSQPNFPLQPGFLRPTSKLLAAGVPSSAGIAAAYFARGGMTGEPKILETPKGFWSRFSFLPLPAMLEGLGGTWVTDTLTIKTYPGCHYFQTALSAAEAIVKRRGKFQPGQVKSIKIETTKLAVEATKFAKECVDAGGAITPVSAAFDLALAVAVLLHSGGIATEDLSKDWLAANMARLGEWTSLIEVLHDPTLTAKVVKCARGLPQGEKSLKSITLRDLGGLAAGYRREYRSSLFQPGDAVRAVKGFLRKIPDGAGPSATPGGPPPLLFPNRVTVEFKKGDREVEQVDLPTGSLANPAMESELRRKFMREVGRTLGPEKAAAAYENGLGLEKATLEEFIGGVRVLRLSA